MSCWEKTGVDSEYSEFRTRELISLHWECLGVPLDNLERGTSGRSCWGCCPCDLAPDKWRKGLQSYAVLQCSFVWERHFLLRTLPNKLYCSVYHIDHHKIQPKICCLSFCARFIMFYFILFYVNNLFMHCLQFLWSLHGLTMRYIWCVELTPTCSRWANAKNCALKGHHTCNYDQLICSLSDPKSLWKTLCDGDNMKQFYFWIISDMFMCLCWNRRLEPLL